MPNTASKNTSINVARYFYKRQLGIAVKDNAPAISVAEIKARLRIVDIRHLNNQINSILSKPQLTEQEQEVTREIVDSMLFWERRNRQDLYTYALLNVPCVLSFFAELFSFDKLGNSIFFKIPGLGKPYSLLFEKLYSQTNNPEYLSYQYVYLISCKNFGQALPLLREASNKKGEAALRARIELLALKLSLLGLGIAIPKLIEHIGKLSSIGSVLDEYINELVSAGFNEGVNQADFEELIDLGSYSALREKHRRMGTPCEERLSYRAKKINQARVEVGQAIESCYEEGLFAPLSDLFIFYTALSLVSGEPINQFIDVHTQRLESLSVDSEPALLYLIGQCKDKTKLITSSKVKTYEVLLGCAENAHGDEIKEYLPKLNPKRDPRSTLIFAQYALQQENILDAKRYYAQSIRPFAIYTVQDTIRVLASYTRVHNEVSKPTQRIIQLWMLHECMNLITCEALLEVKAALIACGSLIYEGQEHENPAPGSDFIFLEDVYEYSRYLFRITLNMLSDLGIFMESEQKEFNPSIQP